ncbi:MAG: zf-HC2 domain-containing protein [Elusimicrobiota bacterium]
MNCREIEPHLRSYLDNEADPELKSLLDKHLRGCPGCAGKLALLERTSALFRRLPPAAAGFDFKVEAQLREAAEGSGASWRGLFDIFGGPGWAVTAAGLAVVLVLTGVVTFRFREQTEPDRCVEAFFAGRRPYYVRTADLSVQDAGELAPGQGAWSGYDRGS